MNPKPNSSHIESNDNAPAKPTRNPQAEIRNPKSDGRPRSLNEIKRREVAALVAGGCGLKEAARYVGCSVRTIRREMQRNTHFDSSVRRSEMYAELSPLRAMQNAVSTHWRAAAWMLERAFPERFAKPDPGGFGARQARELLDEVLQIFRTELHDPFQFDRVDKRVRATFEYHVRRACDRRRNARSLRNAMAYFEQKDQLKPLDPFGFPLPDFSDLLTPLRTSSPNPTHNDPNSTNANPPSRKPICDAASDEPSCDAEPTSQTPPLNTNSPRTA
jgi:hypothetical protein